MNCADNVLICMHSHQSAGGEMHMARYPCVKGGMGLKLCSSQPQWRSALGAIERAKSGEKKKKMHHLKIYSAKIYKNVLIVRLLFFFND